MRVIVYTADCGGHDQVWRPIDQVVPDDWEVSWVRLQETYDFPPGEHGWVNAYLGGPGVPEGLHDRLLGRWAKCHPHVLFPEADVTIWVDACLEILSPSFVREAVLSTSHVAPYAAFPHPDRDNVWQEVEAADTLEKYDGNRHAEMVRRFEGTLPHAITGLWAMTVLVRRNHYQARLIDHLVWAETLAWSTDDATALDQLILPWVLDVLSDDLAPLDAPHPTNYHEPGTLWSNAWFVRHPHRRET